MPVLEVGIGVGYLRWAWLLFTADGALDDEPGLLSRRVDVTLLGRPGEEDSSSRGGSSWDWEPGLFASWSLSHDDGGAGGGEVAVGCFGGSLLPPGEESMAEGRGEALAVAGQDQEGILSAAEGWRTEEMYQDGQWQVNRSSTLGR